MILQEYLYKIGVLTRTHGVGGELSMTFTDDVWDRIDADYVFLKCDGLFVPFFFEGWRFRGNDVALLKFQDIDTKETAERFVGNEVWFPKSLTPEVADDDEITWKMLIGFEVINDADNSLLGTITEADDSTENVLLTIQSLQGNEILLPAHEDFIHQVEYQQRKLYVEIPEEILHLNDK